MPSHSVFPNGEIFANLILPEKLNLLELKVPFLILIIGLFGHELCLFIMIHGDSFAADSHVLISVPIGVSNYLIMVRMRNPIQIEEILNHFWKCPIKGEYIMWLQIGFCT